MNRRTGNVRDVAEVDDQEGEVLLSEFVDGGFFEEERVSVR
jgi:hypothetical protein